MSAQESRPFSFASRTLDLNIPQVMGILNVTPDSFSDGGQHHGLDQALRHAERMLQEGATLIDIGGESTRPGADPVTEQEELERVIPVVEAINARFDAVISVDTSTPTVITEAAKVGAGLINDVRALQREGAVEAAANNRFAGVFDAYAGAAQRYAGATQLSGSADGAETVFCSAGAGL